MPSIWYKVTAVDVGFGLVVLTGLYVLAVGGFATWWIAGGLGRLALGIFGAAAGTGILFRLLAAMEQR